MIQFNIRIFFLGVLISMMFMPYVAFFMILDEGLRYKIETIALLCLYVACLIIPLVIKELDTILLLWLYIFSLVGIPVGSDMAVHVTGITPDRHFSFLQTWALIVMPAYILFLAMLFSRKGYK